MQKGGVGCVGTPASVKATNRLLDNQRCDIISRKTLSDIAEPTVNPTASFARLPARGSIDMTPRSPINTTPIAKITSTKETPSRKGDKATPLLALQTIPFLTGFSR
jgi:hypothetical protein